jgi:hypothetical protein
MIYIEEQALSLSYDLAPPTSNSPPIQYSLHGVTHLAVDSNLAYFTLNSGYEEQRLRDEVQSIMYICKVLGSKGSKDTVRTSFFRYPNICTLQVYMYVGMQE